MRKLLIYLGLLILAAIVLVPAYADPVIKSTSDGAVNVAFSTYPANPNTGNQTLMNIIFINKQTNSIEQHIDYVIFVTEGNNEVYGVPLTHSVNGMVSIPVALRDAATYQVTVEVYGMLFQQCCQRLQPLQ